ncbi:MAG: hypothetical protein ACC608_10155 [Anaerofustis sp.]
MAEEKSARNFYTKTVRVMPLLGRITLDANPEPLGAECGGLI